MFINTSRGILRTLIALSLFIFAPTLASAIPAYPPDTVYNGPQSVPTVARPGYKQSFIDPVFGTKVTRITDNSMGGSEWNWQVTYSKTPVWNSDMSKLMLGYGAFILDATTYNVIRSMGLHDEARWSTVDPNIIFYINGDGNNGNQFRKLNVTTGVDTLIRTFPQNIQIGPGEGNLSIGDRWVVLTHGGTSATLYDIQNDVVVATRNIANDGAVVAVDWISMSQSGNYIVVEGGFDTAFGVRVYDRANFGNLSIPPRRITETLSHADLGFDAAGNEVFVKNCAPMLQARLDNGVETNYLPGFNDCGHVSTRNHDRPGWVLVSGYGTSGAEVFSVKLDGTRTVQRFAHVRSTGDDYLSQPKAAISPDGSKVIWNSDWGNSSGTVYTYVAEMPGGTSSDTTPPTSPGTPTISSLTSTSLTLNWSPSADSVGVTGYRVERCQGSTCTNFTQIVTPTGTSFSDTGLTASTTYRYRVRAVDAAGNLSGYSGFTSATTLAGGPSATNLALNKPVTSSSNYDSTFPASYAVDGNTATRWSSAFSDPEWIRVDLGSSKQINRVVLNWEAAYGQSYKIQVSSDDVNWADIFSTTTGNGGIDDLTGLSGTGRYLRMYGTVRGTPYGYSLWEMEVYGSDASSPLSISMNVACAPNCPLNGTTTAVNVTVLSGTPTSMEFSRDGLPVFLTCPGGSQCYPAPSWGFNWCISSSCWGGVSGSHTLNVTARNASGQTATAAVTMNVSDGLLPPGRLRITP